MWAINVVVSREYPVQPDQVALVDHDDVVQASPAESPHQSLGDRFRLRSELGSTFAPLQRLELKRRIIRDHYREVIDEMYAVWRPRPIKVSWPRRRNSPRALLPEV